MARLTLHLLGPMRATLHSDRRVDFAYDKVRALIAYLVAESDRAHSRSRLAALLWPEKSESAARHSLSQALSVLRTALEDRATESPLLQVDRDNVQFTATAETSVDLHEFNRLLNETEQHGHRERVGCTECLWRLERATGLVKGLFLEGISIPDSEEFEDWVRSRQQMIEVSLTAILHDLVQGLEASGQLSHACDFSQRLIELDPWDENAHRTTMRLLAATGKRAAAIKHFETCRKMLERDLGVEPEDETLELAQRIRAGLEGPTSFNPVTTIQASPFSSLPMPATSFVGREGEVDQIVQLIEDGSSRLMTLVGPGGIGKSRLALEAAHHSKDHFGDGVYFVPLAGLSSPDLLPSAILSAMSAEVGQQDDARAQLLAYVHQREILLLLDNFEHLVEGSLLVSELIESAPGLQVLVTSRERLSLTGEWVYEVEGLSVPSAADPASIATSGAARLFMLSARRHKASFLPRHEDGPAVRRICQLTGGMPLALELAAAWIPILSPEEIAAEIEQSLSFLSSSMRDLPPRHRSVSAVIDRSWENLTELEQRAFRRLSVFRGGFTRAAASYVTGASLPALTALVSKSLLRRNHEGRYEIHELLRQYGEERLLAEEGEPDVVRDRHRDYYIGFLAIREEQLEGKSQISVLGEIEVEVENVRAAWQRAVDTRDFKGLGRAAHSFWLFYEITGRYREGAAALGAAFEAIRALPHVTDDLSDGYRLALAKLRGRQSALGFRLNGPSVVHEQLLEATELLRPLDCGVETGILLNFMASGAHVRGEYDEEESYLIESIEHFERAGHRWGMAYSKNDLGHLRALRGEYLEARELHQSALAILEELGDLRGIAFALRNLGLVASRLGDKELALALLRRSVDVRRPIGNQWGIAESLNQIGVILREGGQPEQASEHFREALHIAREIRAMQLAAEILQEYLPLLPAEPADAASSLDVLTLTSIEDDAHREVISSRVEIRSYGAEQNADRVSRVVDLVLSEPPTLGEAQISEQSSRE